MSVKSKIESVEKTFFKRIDTDFKRMNTDKNMTFKHKICVNPFLYPCTSVLNCKFSTASNCIPQLKILNFGLSFWILLFGFCISGYAQEITLIYSGNTHAMIYPCNCPLEPDGGVSRRAAFIRQIRKDKTNILVVDSGDFIAGGLMDEYSQNTDLDMRRSLISIKAMEMMGYDAVGVGDDEFNFGRSFFEEHLGKAKLALVSCNLVSDKVVPFIIKEVAGVKIGIIGVIGLRARQKAEGLAFQEPAEAVKEAVAQVKAAGAKLVLLLSHLGENEDQKLLKDIPGINIVVASHNHQNEEPATKIGDTLILRPSWQGRHLGKVSFTFDNNRIKEYRAEDLRLSDRVGDDPLVLSVLPKCFSDNNCKKEGSLGTCQNPGTAQATCRYTTADRVPLLIIEPRTCIFCDIKNTLQRIKQVFPGIVVTRLYYPDEKAKKIIQDLGVTFLPVYLLSRDIERTPGFSGFKDNLEKRGDYYALKATFSGIAYFPLRPRIKGKLDLMLSIYDRNTKELLDAIRDFKPTLHFLAKKKEDSFEAAKGVAEVEEYLRLVCVQKYYPASLWSYLTCRVQNSNSSWWQDCLGGDCDAAKVATCARSSEGAALLKENISLNEELEILFGPTYLVDNQDIFSTQGTPAKEDFKKLFKR